MQILLSQQLIMSILALITLTVVGMVLIVYLIRRTQRQMIVAL